MLIARGLLVQAPPINHAERGKPQGRGRSAPRHRDPSQDAPRGTSRMDSREPRETSRTTRVAQRLAGARDDGGGKENAAGGGPARPQKSSKAHPAAGGGAASSASVQACPKPQSLDLGLTPQINQNSEPQTLNPQH